MRVIQQAELCVVAGGADYVPGQDYCTGVPDAPGGFDFSYACYQHDQNYSADTQYTMQEANDIFYSDMMSICENQYNNDLACQAYAYAYYEGVEAFGWFFYEGS